MKTLCKHCLNSCKIFTPNCNKYKTETVEQLHAEKRKMKQEAIDKLNYIWYGIATNTKSKN